MEAQIHLSVVATSRNDNHGGYLTQRTQHFVDGLVAQCRRHRLRAELILVEWNPPADRPPLAADLRWPAAGGPCDIRIVTVPREMHAALAHSDKLPLYQMIAKNVGIRRARGRYVLATNIDILFSDEVMVAMRERLRPGRLYRVDRHDVPTHVPVSPDFGEVLEFCRREEFRLHATGVSLLRREGRWDPPSPLAGMLRPVGQTLRRAIARGAQKSVEHSSNAAGALVAQGAGAGERVGRSAAAAGQLFVGAWNFARGVGRMARRLLGWIWHALVLRELHTNACGDFTLLSREDWFALRGYPEWQVYSWNIDSILLYQSHRSGLREVYLGAAAAIYHIEHSPGSGFTPESSDKLFQRLEAAGIPCLDWERDMMPKVAAMDAARRRGELPITYNDAQWGYAAHTLPEQRVA